MTKPKIGVIGSINVDLVSKANRIPSPGETVIGEEFIMNYGGKGANQAIACSRLGADVQMFGCVGDDNYGQQLLHNLEKNDVNIAHVEIAKHIFSGIASISIGGGDNSIVVVPGANYYLDYSKFIKNELDLKNLDLILASMEVPLKSITTAASIARKYDIPFILNPAPAKELSENLLKDISLITPNEHELPILMGKNPGFVDFRELISGFNGSIVMTKGREGAYYKTDNIKIVNNVSSYPVNVIDSTGAGDAFNAALAYKIGLKFSLEEAVNFAVGIGALAVTNYGAQEGLPTMAEYREFIKEHSSKNFI